MPNATAPALDDYLVHVPGELHSRFHEIVSLTDTFCADHLNDQYRDICRMLAAGIFRYEAPVERGKPKSWACGIVHVIARVNFLTFEDSEPHLPTRRIHSAFGVSSGTMYKWSREIREGMQITDFDTQLMVPSPHHPLVTALEMLDEMQRTLSSVSEDGGEADVELEPPRADMAYELKITLLGTDPPIWRRVQVPDCSLADLHHIIQAAMGWEDAHLHEFQVKKHRYRPEPMEGMPDYLMDDDDASYTCEVLLSEIVPARSRRFRFHYTYDFGDNWEHEIAVEKKLKGAEAEAVARPVCLEGAKACPPEDIGGVWGYYDLLQALKEPQSGWHEELAEMCEEFDPDEFDVKPVNRDYKKYWRG